MVFLNSNNDKVALLIGINYLGHTQGVLNGCINDTIKIKEFLLEKCNFKPENVICITDETAIKPTKQNMLNAIIDLVQRVKSTNSKEVWFSYSGHGYYYTSETEIDNKDEVLVPLDYQQNGCIRDDVLYSLLIKELPKDCNLFSLIDACHSGTSLDLPYMYRTDTGIKEQRTPEEIANVIKISGCRDCQTSADAYINGKYQGAMTFSFLRSIEDLEYNFTPKQLIGKLQTYINANGYDQVPTLTFSNLNLLDNAVMGIDNPLYQDCNIKIHLEGDEWCTEETSWNISNTDGNKIFKDDRKFYQKNEKINYNLKLTDGDYSLNLKDTYGDGGVNGYISYINSKKTISTFNFNSGNDANYKFNIKLSNDVMDQVEKKLVVKISGDNWCKYESKWNIIDESGNNIFKDDIAFNCSNEQQSKNVELKCGNYKLKCVDSYGDGGITGFIKSEIGNNKLLTFNFNSGSLKYYDFIVQ